MRRTRRCRPGTQLPAAHPALGPHLQAEQRPQRAPALVTPLGQGVLLVRKPGGEELRWRVSGGFFEVGEDRATVLADEVSAEPA
jgi:ATP synthase, Delta/Epsilon chain, beta-sandwich domain.